jgi:hypothetical protein
MRAGKQAWQLGAERGFSDVQGCSIACEFLWTSAGGARGHRGRCVFGRHTHPGKGCVLMDASLADIGSHLCIT